MKRLSGLTAVLVGLAAVPTTAQATGGPASAISGLQSPMFLLAGGLFVVFASVACWAYFRRPRASRQGWWLLGLLLLGSAVAATIGAVVLIFPLIFLLMWLET